MDRAAVRNRPGPGDRLVFVVIGIIGLVTTLLALGSRYYRDLSAAVAGGRNEPDDENGYAQVAPG